MAFDLSQYETVDERLHKWWKEFPDGRLETEIIEASQSRFIVICKLYRTEADPKPYSTGIASETVSDRGVNANFALPNCETSAIGRAISNAGLSPKGKRPSREEMTSVASYSPAGSRARAVENVLRASFAEDKPTVWSVGDAIEAMPVNPKAQECKHGSMILKEGVSKTGRDFYGYVCSAAKPEQCEAKWAKKTAAGSWFFASDSEGGD
jgi:hypothetical protein